MAMLGQPAKESADGDQVAIDRGNGLPFIAAKVISEVGDVPRGDSADREPLAVCPGEPSGKLLDVVGERPSGMACQVVGSKEGSEQGRFVRPDGDTVENIITTILHALILQI
jgi:hypothetical protein